MPPANRPTPIINIARVKVNTPDSGTPLSVEGIVALPESVAELVAVGVGVRLIVGVKVAEGVAEKAGNPPCPVVGSSARTTKLLTIFCHTPFSS